MPYRDTHSRNGPKEYIGQGGVGGKTRVPETNLFPAELALPIWAPGKASQPLCLLLAWGCAGSFKIPSRKAFKGFEGFCVSLGCGQPNVLESRRGLRAPYSGFLSHSHSEKRSPFWQTVSWSQPANSCVPPPPTSRTAITWAVCGGGLSLGKLSKR